MILGGTFSGRCYRVEGRLPPNWRERWAKNLQRNAFRPINPSSDTVRSAGWVNPRQMLDADLDWGKLCFGPYVVLGLRVDKRQIDKAVRAAHEVQAEAETLAKGHRAKLTNEERAALRQAVYRKLLAHTTPTTTVYEVAWHLETGRVWFSTTSAAANREFVDLFAETFDTTLVPEVPHTLAERWVESAGTGAAALEEAAPSDFRPPQPFQARPAGR